MTDQPPVYTGPNRRSRVPRPPMSVGGLVAIVASAVAIMGTVVGTTVYLDGRFGTLDTGVAVMQTKFEGFQKDYAELKDWVKKVAGKIEGTKP